MPTLQDIYLAYLDCLNRQAFDELGTFVADNVEHNGRPFGLSGYRDMLENDFADIPDPAVRGGDPCQRRDKGCRPAFVRLHAQIHLHGPSSQWQEDSVLRACVLRI